MATKCLSETYVKIPCSSTGNFTPKHRARKPKTKPAEKTEKVWEKVLGSLLQSGHENLIINLNVRQKVLMYLLRTALRTPALPWKRREQWILSTLNLNVDTIYLTSAYCPPYFTWNFAVSATTLLPLLQNLQTLELRWLKREPASNWVPVAIYVVPKAVSSRNGC